jgi:alpha,alpha-trehalose-phosphate synthase [UDP-forming]
MAIWTKDDLFDLLSSEFSDYRFVVVSNREPYVHTQSGGKIECKRPAGGMAAALDPILRASRGVWVAHGSGNADRVTVDGFDHVQVPPENPSYTLRRVWLPKEIEEPYYNGLSNEGLWPLCHIAFERPAFSASQWESYRAANQIFANAVIEETKGQPTVVFIQDYHLALLPRMLKDRDPNLIVAQFWHIPWPNPEAFRVFPWKDELLDGMLGNDLLGFHLRYHCQNFLDTADRNLEALADKEHSTVQRNGRTTFVRAFPISIDAESHSRKAKASSIDREMQAWSERLGSFEFLGIGIDRVDYTKGIPEKLRALDVLLAEHPEYVGKLVFAQVGVPSRTAIAKYDRLNEEVLQLVSSINDKWRQGSWQPIHFIHEHVDMSGLMALHRMADFCLVASLHDGMNLVAKEFVASRFDEDGVLILSSFTGSARELTCALLVNPFAPDEIAAAINTAILMSPEERQQRMRRMRQTIQSNNIYRWAGKILNELLRLESPSGNTQVSEVSNAAAARFADNANFATNAGLL